MFLYYGQNQHQWCAADTYNHNGYHAKVISPLSSPLFPEKCLTFLQQCADWGHGVHCGSICHSMKGQGEWTSAPSPKPPAISLLLISLRTAVLVEGGGRMDKLQQVGKMLTVAKLSCTWMTPCLLLHPLSLNVMYTCLHICVMPTVHTLCFSPPEVINYILTDASFVPQDFLALVQIETFSLYWQNSISQLLHVCWLPMFNLW